MCECHVRCNFPIQFAAFHRSQRVQSSRPLPDVRRSPEVSVISLVLERKLLTNEILS